MSQRATSLFAGGGGALGNMEVTGAHAPFLASLARRAPAILASKAPWAAGDGARQRSMRMLRHHQDGGASPAHTVRVSLMSRLGFCG